ncbi:ATP-binding protein [Salmonella enterica]|uniref:ATP-binding protein n=1 Tax=Salmonella enterica TaxID=28901 RepID=UPI0008FC5A51|nr:ATP-binding protein [Salmonella enterica]EAM4436537.1 ATP-binding protein [Salmonella enterica subsp. enterica serovar Give]EAN3269633.1 ATP-binding protein [Salmonella enterica subsp. enterica serovar Oranienburg]EAU5127752.1 ATP-binding protein [Salmonella enterica subsp. enterica serovar Infantis]ECX5681452.1 ATP-binding protein [Salmonella enterica subsp. enterica serovar Newport]EDQ6564571.1 ATP-binding protein [Salmonella enterica subsp. houtenae]EDQ7107830.1 ATP-binding protein [Sal
MNASEVRSLVVSALKGQTLAEDRVYSPRDWPTATPDYPVLLVQTPYDEKQSMGRNAPQFTSVTTIRISGRVEVFDSEVLDGAVRAEAALENLREQIDRSVINSYELTRKIQQFKSIRSAVAVSAEGEGHTGQLTYEIDVEYFQGPGDFYPVTGTPIDEMSITVDMPDGTTEPVVVATLKE